MDTKEIKIGDKIVQGYEIKMPNAMLVLAIAAKGYVICGYLNMETADKLGDCAAVVTGVSSIDELLSKNVVKVSASAKVKGIEPGMSGLSALSKMF
ncbi:MAG: DUF1805 domain-containing protein [Elusimicrobiota bacterium]